MLAVEPSSQIKWMRLYISKGFEFWYIDIDLACMHGLILRACVDISYKDSSFNRRTRNYIKYPCKL
jgi:hypothetical protein